MRKRAMKPPEKATGTGFYQTPRLRARRRAEARLKACGLGAIALAALALAALLGSVAVKSTRAFSESHITLPVYLDAAKIDPKGSGDPRLIRRADFAGLVKKALRATFPDVRKRKEKRALYGLVSGGAAHALATRVAADPALLGQTLDVALLASDISDLYLKGAYGKLRAEPVKGRLSAVLDGSRVHLSSSAADFAPVLASLRATLLKKATRLRAQAGRQHAGALEYRARAAAAATARARTDNAALAAGRETARDRLLAQAGAIEARARIPQGAEALDGTLPSVLIEVAGGWIRLTKLSASRAEGRIYAPISAPLSEWPAATQNWRLLVNDTPENARKVSDRQTVWLEVLRARGAIERRFDWRLFSASDSREPELAGLWGAIVGSFWTMLVTFTLAFPVGVFGAIHLEEFAPKNRLTRFVEVSINNLAAVPSIVFGLLGLALFLGVFGVPRSSPLAGGLVLALMTLPTIVIATRAALRAVPPSIREAALGVGASRMQTTFHHVLPLAMPGILTGTIIGMSQALGETAPLIMIGMVAFIVDVPHGVLDSATVLPVQVYRWSDFPERAFEARTAAAILVLLGFLVLMNLLAVVLRRRFERRW